MIIILFGVSFSNADEPYNEESVNNTHTTQVNLPDIYFKGMKISKPKGICKQNLCLTKCCPFGTQYNVRSQECVNTTQIFDPDIYDIYSKPQNINASKLFYFKIGIINCTDILVVRFQISIFALKVNKEFMLRTDGKLMVETPHNIPPWLLVSPENYCIDNFVDDSEGENITQVDALVCFPNTEDLHNYILSATCMLVSCAFILLTVGVYIWLPKLHNVHGRVLVVYLTCLFVGFLFMATMQLLLHYDNITNETCEYMAYIIYFSLLSAFFWLNIMCYDIWRVFSGKREIRPQKQQIWLQIRSYAIYAFGIPAVLTILLISLEHSGLPQNPWLPLIRLQGCFLSGNTRLIYLYGPILILCVANMILFALTATKIAITRKQTSVLSSKESSRHDQQNDKKTLLLYIKLFILMGISWILEVISAIYPNPNWVYSDVYNVLIGVVIFIIFVCKRQIFNLLKERYKEVRNQPASQNQTSWSRTTTTKDETAFNSKSSH